MARWVLDCPQCHEEFTHSEITSSQITFSDPFTQPETKPPFPEGGQEIACPNCNQTAVYQRYQLVYRAH